MAEEPVRFIQASRLLLDHPLSGVSQASPAWRETIRDASLMAYERVIDLCCEYKVDFLLLGGDSFDDRDEGLRGQTALVRGFRRLHDWKIPVFITTGACDPWSSWLPGLDLPPNVVRLGVDGGAVVPVERNGETIAWIQAVNSLSIRDTDWEQGRWPIPSVLLPQGDGRLSIALLRGGLNDEQTGTVYGSGLCFPTGDLQKSGVPYWAFSGHHANWSYEPFEGCIAHDSGGPQAFHPSETGPHGVTLVKMSGQERETMFLPTAPVRFEDCRLLIQESTDRDTLLRAMRAELADLPRHATDRLWLIRWQIRGTGALYERLREPAWRTALEQDLAADPGVPGVIVASNSWQWQGLESPVAQDQSPHPFVTDYLEAWQSRMKLPAQTLSQCLAASTVPGQSWESNLSALLPELDLDEVTAETRRLGFEWFAVTDRD